LRDNWASSAFSTGSPSPTFDHRLAQTRSRHQGSRRLRQPYQAVALKGVYGRLRRTPSTGQELRRGAGAVSKHSWNLIARGSRTWPGPKVVAEKRLPGPPESSMN
jgi:hypothetical protein